MSLIPRFLEYASAFEHAYESDDWKELVDFFAPDAVYETGLSLFGADRIEGKDELLLWFPDVVNRFDRRFASRELVPKSGPTEADESVRILGAAVYASPGLPDFVLELEETIEFKDGLIVRLEDRYSEEMQQKTRDFFDEHGERLGLSSERA